MSQIYNLDDKCVRNYWIQTRLHSKATIWKGRVNDEIESLNNI